jgi:hypothetical protein
MFRSTLLHILFSEFLFAHPRSSIWLLLPVEQKLQKCVCLICTLIFTCPI